MKSIIRFFSSVKLAIILLIIITCASILGTLIPQMRTPAEYTARYGQLASLFMGLKLTSLYHSWWYNSMLLLFGLNIIVCTLTRLFPKIRKALRPKLSFDQKQITVLKINDRYRKNWSLAKTKEALERELRSRRYRLREEKSENRILLQGRKRILGWFGSDVVHLGLLIILVGGITSGISGFKEYLSLSEGQVLPVPRAGFNLRLDRFETEYYPNGNVRDWKSTVTVLEGENPVLTKVIEVNHPLSFRGFVFYQSSYGWNWENPALEVWIKKRSDPSFLKKVELKAGQRVKVEENIDFSVLRFIPDFVLNESNQAVTRSLEPNNPAAEIEGWQGGEKIFSGWIFSKFPDFARIHSEREIETDMAFELKNFRAGQYSVLQAAKDPGVNIIWVGCSFLMAGLALAFYWPTQEIKIILEEASGKTEVFAGGIASKNRDAFQSEFEKIMSTSRREK